MLLARSQSVANKTLSINSASRASGVFPSQALQTLRSSCLAFHAIACRDLKRHYSDTYLEHPREADKRLSGLDINNIQNVSSVDEPTERVRQLVDEILALNFLEAAQLSTELGKRLGVPKDAGAFSMQPQAPAPVAAEAPAPESPKAEEPKVKTVADVKLMKYQDSAKFKVLKEIRNLKPGMNLMESKALIEGLPKIVMMNLPYKEAEEWKKGLTEAGAEVELV